MGQTVRSGSTGRRTASSRPAAERAVYTVAEVAELLGLALRNVYPMVSSGEIPARRMGGRWVIPKERFHAWLNGQEETTKAAGSAPAQAGGR